MLLLNDDDRLIILLWLIYHLLPSDLQVEELTMLTMEGRPKEPSMRPSSLTKRSGERLNLPASWTLSPWSPLTTPMCSHLEETPPEETQF